MADEQVTPPKKKKPLTWLLYMSILASGVLLLADALNYAALEKLTAKLGIALLLSALFLVVGNGRRIGFISTGIIWAAVIITFFF